MNAFFQESGALADDTPSYVERPADAELLEVCRTQSIGYILAPRQTGKSSLVIRACARLASEHVRTAFVDVTAIGKDLDREAWYLGILEEVRREVGRGAGVAAWWEAHATLSDVQRLMLYLEEQILEPSGRVVLFLDEIDAVRGLPFSTDEFFAAIRAFHNRAARRPEVARLCFVLLGVASPQDLIRDPRTTPFNIGRRIDLGDFTRQEASVLERGLYGAQDPAAVLDRVFYWTDGHPRLTQALCAKLVRATLIEPESVDALVRDEYLRLADRHQESTLGGIERYADEERAAGWLEIYLRVLRGEGPRVSSSSEDQTQLRLVGLVRVGPKGSLVPRNRIFEAVFDEAWVQRRRRREDTALQRWESTLRHSSDPVAAFSAAVELLDAAPQRFHDAVRYMERSSRAALFEVGAAHADGGDVLRLAAAMLRWAPPSVLAAMLRAIDRTAESHANRATMREAVAVTLRHSHRLVVHVVWHPKNTTANDLARAIHRSLSGDALEQTTPRLQIPVFLHDAPYLLSDEPAGSLEPWQVERTVIVALVDDHWVTDQAWVACVERIVDSVSAPGSTTSLVPVTTSYSSGPFRLLEDRMVMRLKEGEEPRLLIAIAVHLLGLLGPGEGQRADDRPARLFLSYARIDGTDRPKQILDYTRTIAGLGVTFDEYSFAPGDQLTALEPMLQGRALIAFVSEHYSKRAWCRQEFLTAKRLGVPLVAVDISEGGVARSFPYLGNVPTSRWREDERYPAELVQLATFELLRHRYLMSTLEDFALARSLRPARIMARPPELLDVVGLDFEGSRTALGALVLHPDPPITPEEKEILGRADPSLRAMCASEIIAGEARLKRPNVEPLRVALSMSESDVFPRGLTGLHFEEASMDLARLLFVSGATLAFGGDFRRNSLTNMLIELAQLRKRSEDIALQCYPPWPTSLTLDLAEVASLQHLVKFERLDAPKSKFVDRATPSSGAMTPAQRYLRVRGLTEMRRKLLRDVDAMVVIGGRTTGYLGRYPGIVEEAYLAVSLRKPLFVLGGFGGAAGLVAAAVAGGRPEQLTAEYQLRRSPAHGESLPRAEFVTSYNDLLQQDTFADPEWDRIDFDAVLTAFRGVGAVGLTNALTEEENQLLMRSSSTSSVSALVLAGLHRLYAEKVSRSERTSDRST